MENDDKEKESEFKVKDKRSALMNEDELKRQEAQQKKTSENEKSLNENIKEKEDKDQSLPAVNFSMHVITLYEQAAFYMGFTQRPDGQKQQINLPLSKMIIETLDMLKDKTKGNLIEQEAKLLEEALYDIKMKYVSKIKEV